MTTNQTTSLDDVIKFARQKEHFTGGDIATKFGITVRQAHGYVSRLSHRKCITRDDPPKDDVGLNRWVFVEPPKKRGRPKKVRSTELSAPRKANVENDPFRARPAKHTSSFGEEGEVKLQRLIIEHGFHAIRQRMEAAYNNLVTTVEAQVR
jgi:hypothetical protein